MTYGSLTKVLKYSMVHMFNIPTPVLNTPNSYIIYKGVAPEDFTGNGADYRGF